MITLDNEIFDNFLHRQRNVPKLLTIKRLKIIDYIHNESSPNHCLHIDHERSPNHWLCIDNKTFPNNFLHRQRNIPKSLTMYKQLNVSELLNINYTTELFKSVLLKISLTQLSWLNIQFASMLPLKILTFFIQSLTSCLIRCYYV